jgi:hypothetical protein
MNQPKQLPKHKRRWSGLSDKSLGHTEYMRRLRALIRNRNPRMPAKAGSTEKDTKR